MKLFGKKLALADRPRFEELLDKLNKGDTLVVWKLDRLGRSMLDLIKKNKNSI